MNPIDLARPEIRAIKPYASARALADSAGLLLNANESPWAPAGDNGLGLNRYPDPQPVELKQRLADLYGVRSEQILITRGSDEGIDLLTRAFCQAGKDRVLICPPCFGMYALSARIQGAAVIEVPLLETGDDWCLDLAGIQSSQDCKLYYLCSPNNPTGNLIAAEDILALARNAANHGLVIIDEAYIEFCDQPSLAAQVETQANLVVLRTLSKAYALAGCRIGALVADPAIIDLLGRIMAPYPLPTPSIQAALTALASSNRQTRQLATIAAEKKRLVTALKAHSPVLKVWPGQANFVLVRVRDAKALVQAAAKAGIRLRDQSAQPGLDDCVRITIGAPDENSLLIEFLKRWSA
jgi:histidinol-phosphate aminotransferase